MKLIIAYFISFHIFSFAFAYPGSKPNLGIIGGQTAAAGQFPYVVSVQQCFWLLGCSHYCSGTVIAPTWIVTTAQCYEKGVSYKVLAGVLELNEHSNYKEVIDVNQTVIHYAYGGNENPINDIALMQLKSALKFNARILPINLPTPNAESTGNAVVMGWGDTTGNDDYPNTLNYINLNIIEAAECKKEMDSIIGANSDPFDGSVHICTSDERKGKSICSGDGGAPLVQNETFVGTASWGISPCGTIGAPSVYTKVSNYIDWITDHMQD